MAQTIQIWDADTGEVNSTIIPQNASAQHIFSSPEQTPTHIFSVLNINQVDSFSDTSTLAAGWIHNSFSKLLFWVPFWHRLGLCWPRNLFVIALGSPSTRFDMDDFQHGDSWQQCKALHALS